MQNLIFNLVFSECKAWLASKDDDMLDDDMIMCLVVLNTRGVTSTILVIKILLTLTATLPNLTIAHSPPPMITPVEP
jgi:hypothetical protein